MLGGTSKRNADIMAEISNLLRKQLDLVKYFVESLYAIMSGLHTKDVATISSDPGDTNYEVNLLIKDNQSFSGTQQNYGLLVVITGKNSMCQ